MGASISRPREESKEYPAVESEYEGDGNPLVDTAKTNNEASTSTYGTEIETSEKAPTEEVRRIIENGLENIQQSCEELREENRSETEKKLEQLVKQTVDISQKYSKKVKLGKKDLSSYIKFRRSLFKNFLGPLTNKIIEQFTRSTITDLIFYYLMNDEQPKTRPNTDTSTSRFYHSHNWYELCSSIMGANHTEFYNRLDNNSAALEYVINKHPRLLLNQLSNLLVYRLCEYLPRERVHEMLMTVRDENGQTCLYYWIDGALPALLYNYYKSHTDKLYETLSIQNVNKQTALHVNTTYITRLLILTYTPEQRDQLTKLITIPDINNKTALDTAEGWVRDRLSWLIDQVEFPRYVLYHLPNVLIIYNTDQRDGAEEEAKTIYDAFESTKLFNTKLHKDKEKDEMLKLIEESANKESVVTQSALIVVLLSHGSVGVIDDCKGSPVNFTSIESAMCQKKLQNRPKILIAQCCQVRDDTSEHYKHSKKHDIKVPHPREPYVPKNPDFCAIMSSVPGEPSEREVFIPKLAEQIRNCEDNEDIELLVKRVCQQMLAENKSQTPVILSTLKASFCAMNRDQVDKQWLLS